MYDDIIVRALNAVERREFIGKLAQLRIEVFRDWPYLYDGDLDYENKYLKTYLDASDVFLAGAFVENALVGASTAMPLIQHETAFIEPLKSAGFDVDAMFYFGESVLKAEFRGRGIGVNFFKLREAEAKRQGCSSCVFSAVERISTDKAHQMDYVSLDAFWKKRGYEKLSNVQASYSWRDIGDSQETVKPMSYWLKELAITVT